MQKTTLFTAAAILLFAATPACEKDDGVTPQQRLCGGTADFATRIDGRANPLVMCLADNDVTAFLTAPPDRYNITARYSNSEGVFELKIVFDVQQPANLTPTASLSELETLPQMVWLYYIEIPASGGPTIESFSISGGFFQLGFNDGNVVAATFSDVMLEMRDQNTQTPVGTRLIKEGNFSLTVQ